MVDFREALQWTLNFRPMWFQVPVLDKIQKSTPGMNSGWSSLDDVTTLWHNIPGKSWKETIWLSWVCVCVCMVSFWSCNKYHDQKQLRGGKGSVYRSQFITESGQEFKQEDGVGTMKECCTLSQSQAQAKLIFSYSLCREWCCLQWAGPLKSVDNQENPQWQTHTQPDLGSPLVMALFSDDLRLCQVNY